MVLENQTEKNNENAAGAAGASASAATTVTQEPKNNETTFDFDAWIKESPRLKYLALEKGTAKVIRFKSGRPDEMLMTDFKGKLEQPVPVARYLVTTSEEPNEQLRFDVTSKRLAGDINAYFAKGFSELEITKLNTTPVSYRVIPMIAREKQQQMAAPGRA